MSRWIGIDFSGNHLEWRPGRRKSNVWIAELVDTLGGLSLERLYRVQSLPGDGPPFERLGRFLAAGEFIAAAIDAPFALPAEFMPASGFEGLKGLVAEMPHEGRPFPKAVHLIEAVASEHQPRGLKAYRATEDEWRARGVNVRSTMWAGPRGGAAFTLACVRLLGLSGLPVWPWAKSGGALVAEAFPAAQLREWGLPHQGYNGQKKDAPAVRVRIVEGVCERFPALDLGEYRATIEDDADALDALLCAFSARAVSEGRLASLPGEQAESEGWIAVHR